MVHHFSNLSIALIECDSIKAKSISNSIEEKFNQIPVVFDSVEAYLKYYDETENDGSSYRLLIADIGDNQKDRKFALRNIGSTRNIKSNVLVISTKDTAEKVLSSLSSEDQFREHEVGAFLNRVNLLFLENDESSQKNGAIYIQAVETELPVIRKNYFVIENTQVKVTKKERDILRLLVASYKENKFLLRETAERELWSNANAAIRKSYDVHLCSLRKKLTPFDWLIDYNYSVKGHRLRKW